MAELLESKGYYDSKGYHDSDVHEKAKNSAQSLERMMLESILKSAMDRKPERLSFETTYSHMNIKEWVRSIFPSYQDWDIIVPATEKTITISEQTISSSSSSKELINLALPVQPESEVSFALSEWPTSGEYRAEVKHWINQNHYIKATDVDDFIDGAACEPLAYFLSKFMAKDMGGSKYNGGNNNDEKYDVQYLFRLYREAKKYMDKFPAGITCRSVLFLDYYLRQEVKSPNFWVHVKESGLENPSFKDFLFGHDLAKINIMKVIESRDRSLRPICIPLYVLCYLFDENELTNDELQMTSVETAQFSLHVVGLVVYNDVVMVADPNGVLRGGSNMEFLSMPLTPLESQPTTCVSCYDRDVKANEAAQAKANAQAALAMVVKARVKKAKAVREEGACDSEGGGKGGEGTCEVVKGHAK